jgi:hypothetical protein
MFIPEEPQDVVKTSLGVLVENIFLVRRRVVDLHMFPREETDKVRSTERANKS